MFWFVTSCRVVDSYQRLWETYHLHLQGPLHPEDEGDSSSETLVIINITTQRQNAEDHNRYLHHFEKLRSRICYGRSNCASYRVCERERDRGRAKTSLVVAAVEANAAAVCRWRSFGIRTSEFFHRCILLCYWITLIGRKTSQRNTRIKEKKGKLFLGKNLKNMMCSKCCMSTFWMIVFQKRSVSEIKYHNPSLK